MIRKRTRIRAFLPALLAIALAALAPASPAPAAAPFDGSWSVVIITDDGDCDRAYRYPVEIVNGQLRYSGEVGIEFSGKVDRSGNLQAALKRGAQIASGRGHLTRDMGTGTWTGQSRTAQCSGRWKAERRG